MLIFDDNEANLIIAGLNKLVKEFGLERPDIYQAAHNIKGKLEENARVNAETALAIEQTKLDPAPQVDSE